MNICPSDMNVDTEKLLEAYIKSNRLVVKFRNNNESADYVKGYRNGYNQAIQNLLNNIKGEIKL